jgi:hypothetical protein
VWLRCRNSPFHRGTQANTLVLGCIAAIASIGSFVLGLRDAVSLAAMQIFGRIDDKSPWVAIGAPIPAARFQHVDAGVRVPLAWPSALRAKGTIVAELKIVLAFDNGVTNARLDRAALYPRTSELRRRQ